MQRCCRIFEPKGRDRVMRLVTYQQLAEALQVSRTTIERMVRGGRLPKPVKLSAGQSSSARFDMDQVEVALVNPPRKWPQFPNQYPYEPSRLQLYREAF